MSDNSKTVPQTTVPLSLRALDEREQSLRAAAERVLGCWTIVERTNGILGADGLRVAIAELTKVCDSYV